MKIDVSTIIIKEFEEIVFKALVSFESKKRYLRVLLDEFGYEEMIKELIYDGVVSYCKEKEEILDIGEYKYKKEILKEDQRKFNNIDELVKFLKDDGFDVEISKDYKTIFSVGVDGQDMGYSVISNTNKVKTSNIAILLNAAANEAINNPYYEPIEREKAGSYVVEIQDVSKNIDLINKIILILKDLKNGVVDKAKFWNKGKYYKLIEGLVEFGHIKHLEKIEFLISDYSFVFSKMELKKIELSRELILSSKAFLHKIKDQEIPYAFDENNLSFKIKVKGKVLFFRAANKDIFEKIEQNYDKTLELIGSYISVKTIKIENINMLSDKVQVEKMNKK